MSIIHLFRKKTNLIRLTGALAILFAAATIADVVQYQVTTVSLPGVIASAEKSRQQDEETVQKYLAAPKESAGGLKRKNMFAPVPGKPSQPVCTGLFGDTAVFGDKLYNIGDEVSGAKIVAIGPNDVTILWEEKETKLIPFGVANSNGSGGDRRGGDRREEGRSREGRGSGEGRPTVATGGPPEGRFRFEPTADQRARMEEMRDRFMNATPEEREKLREEFRQRMGFGDRGPGGGMGGGMGGGFGGGPGGRGGR
ncbi:MAG: hypothetical protein JW828_08340 [Sedimentisphaerales bacterium]|nr:hypothetical protein [Sedimentisphaerales bacterium]